MSYGLYWGYGLSTEDAYRRMLTPEEMNDYFFSDKTKKRNKNSRRYWRTINGLIFVPLSVNHEENTS